jgi:hypothetical protein
MNAVAVKDLNRAFDHEIELFDSRVGTFSTSASDPEKLYQVNSTHCDCKGFEHRGHCKHHALFVARVIDDGLRYFGL